MWKLEIQQTKEEIFDMLQHMGIRPSMWTPCGSYSEIASFLAGYDTATGLLKGFREWLIPKAGMDCANLIFVALVLYIAFPDAEGGFDPVPDEAFATKTLCNLVIEFLYYKNEVGADKIIADYEEAHATWLAEVRRKIKAGECDEEG